MRGYPWYLLCVLFLCCHCNNDNAATDTAPNYKTTELCERCDEKVQATLADNLESATEKELAAFLCTLAANCPTEEATASQKRHALLIQSLDQHLEVVLEILASGADLERAHILDLLQAPATQPLPQRALVLRLRKRSLTTEIEQQVLKALEQSVETGDAKLLDALNDKSHTYQ